MHMTDKDIAEAALTAIAEKRRNEK
jgi:hypothetical protein